MREMRAWRASGSQMLHGAPTGTYSQPSGPKRMNFQPWCVSRGKRSVTRPPADAGSARGLPRFVVAQDAADLGDVQGAVAYGHAVRPLRPGATVTTAVAFASRVCTA